MQIFNDKKERVGILKDFKERKIVKTLDSGDKELTFKYPSDGKQVDLLKEEYYIRTKEDEYVIRKRKTGTQFNEYTAQLNVEELEGAVFPYGFESKTQTIRACLEFAFEGTGWKVGICQITKKRTINKDEETNAWKVLQDCLSTYRAECKINSLTKTIDIYEQIGADRGRYFIEGLNLKKLTVTSDTYDFYTRLIPLGKDGIGIEWLGKPYLENYQYSNKIKTYVWSDERYTNTTSLIEDGNAKLEEMSKPYVAYKADVIDLARQSKKYSSVFDFDIGDTVWMISKKTQTKEKQRIVKLTEYPETPRNNTVELSNTTKTFAEVQQQATDKAKTEAIKIANSSAKKTLEDNYYTKTETETHITASKEEIELGVSKVYETKTIVEEKIKSANELTDEKLTEYYTKEETKSAINLKADEIDLGVSKVYETKTIVEEKIKSANELTDEKLTEYYTKEETKSAIDMTAENINLSVSKTYATQTTVTEKYNSAVKAGQTAANTAEKNAKNAMYEKLTEYSTTEEMKSAIDMTAENINLSVSKTYATQTTVTEKYNSAVKAGQTAANTAEKNAKNAMYEKLTEYSTTEEMKSAIDMTAENINLSVSKTYATQTTVTEKYNSAITAGQNAAKTAEKNATAAGQTAANAAEKNANAATDKKLQEYSTTKEMKSAIELKLDEINLSVSKTYATQTTVTEKYNSAVKAGQTAANTAEKNATAAGQTAANTAEKNANAATDRKLQKYSTTEEMNSAIKLKADSITTEVNKKVDSSEFGTKITQNAYSVRVAWNNNSNYIQLESGKIAIYNGEVTTNQKRAVFDQNGNHFYRDGYYVGNIGTNYWSGNETHKGLVFDLDYQGKYMAFAQKPSSSSNAYSTMLCFSRANSIYDTYGVHMGCDLDMHNFKLKNVSWEKGGITGTLNFVKVVKMDSDGTVSTWTNDCKLQFENGILIAGTW